MWWQYVLVFLGSMLMDITPLPLPPALVIMIFLLIKYDLNVWIVVIAGVAGSILGRTILTMYIPKLSHRIFNKAKNEDVQYLGSHMNQKGWKGRSFILGYALLPLPSTPFFIAAGMARIGPLFLIPPFALGKIIINAIAIQGVLFVVEKSTGILEGLVSWQSISALTLGLLLVFALLFIDWRHSFMEKRPKLKFGIWKEKRQKQ